MASESKRTSGCGGGGTGAAAGLRLPEQGLNCPRCDSPNTKFCYYNNYSLTQPRHFCKSCRRYWTKGGALRTVPVGGGCRKNRKSKSSSSSSAASSSSLPEPPNALAQTTAAVMDFHLGSFLPYSFAPTANAAASAGSIASSIESLSTINQDLHWKLQQQRMQIMFGGDQQPQQKQQSVVSFMDGSSQAGPSCVAVAEKNNGEIFLESSSGQGNIGAHRSSETAAGSTAWFLDGHFAMPSAASGINDNVAATINNPNSVTDWNGIAAAWSDMQHFTALP